MAKRAASLTFTSTYVMVDNLSIFNLLGGITGITGGLTVDLFRNTEQKKFSLDKDIHTLNILPSDMHTQIGSWN